MGRKKGRKPNQAGRLQGEGQYVKLSYRMLQSEAWRSLSGSALKVWLELRTRFNGGNNGKLHLSLDEGARILKMGKATISRAFEELEQKGFVVMKRRGQWYGRLATEWAVTDVGIDGNIATKAWQQWRRPKLPIASVPEWNINSERGSETDHNPT